MKDIKFNNDLKMSGLIAFLNELHFQANDEIAEKLEGIKGIELTESAPIEFSMTEEKIK